MKIKIIMLGIFAAGLCLSACSPLQIVASSYNASAQPTATPGETTTDIAYIVKILNQMAEKNMGMVQMEGWWRRNNTVISQSGDLYSSDHEEWSHLPSTQSECMAKMDISTDASTGEVVLMQMQLPEGYLGDLISLRQGTSEVMKVDPAFCRLTAESTEAGYLAQSLQGGASSKDSRGEVEWANATFKEQEGKPVFVVYAGFRTPFDKLTTQTEGYTFDVNTGMAINRYLSMSYQDGAIMGEFEVQSRYELWEELPVDVAAQYDQASEELKTYVGKSPSTPSPDIMPEPTAQPVNLESLMEPYTKENPLTDETQLVDAVQELTMRQDAWMSQPGWLLQKQLFVPGKDFTREQYILVHITGDNGECQEQMVYFYKDSVLSPWIIRLADGASANMYSLEQSSDTEGQVKENTLCSLKNGESVFFEGDFLLVNEAKVLRDFIANQQKGLVKGDVKAWVDELDDHPAFVLAYHTENDPADNGMVMNPATQEIERFTQSNKLNYYDLENGTPVWHIQNFTLESGVVTDYGGGMRYTWQIFDELPKELEQAYTQAAEELESYLPGE